MTWATGRGTRVTKVVPWSERDERWATRVVILDTALIWVFGVLAGIFLFVPHALPLAGLTLFAALGFFFLLMRDSEKLSAMLQNKVVGAGARTAWIELRPWQTEIYCSCSRPVSFDGAPFYPNDVDRGGGRYSVVCPCGQGYFKLAEGKSEV